MCCRIIQKDYRVLFWNDCLENWTGISKNQIVGTDLANHYPHLKEPKYYSRIETVKKIQTIQYDRIIPHDSKTTIINLDQKTKDFIYRRFWGRLQTPKKILGGYNQIDLMRATGIQNAMLLLAENNYDIILSDYQLEDGTTKDLLLKMT